MTQQQLKEHLHYDEVTGVITIIKPTSNRQQIGDIVSNSVAINLFGKAYGTLSILALYLYNDYSLKLITLDGTSSLRLFNLYKVGSEIDTELTQELLKKFLDYNPDTGIFTWRARYITNIKVGSIAGGVQGTLPDKGYRVITLLGTNYSAHRLAWLYVYGSFPDKQIDHINHNRDDNRIANLREVSNHTNMKNKSKYATNTTGYSGVEQHGSNWKARIGVNGTKVLLGVFRTIEEAIAARKAAEKLLTYHTNHGL